MKNKNLKPAFLGGAVSAAAAVLTLICRFILSSEMNRIESSGAMIVISGSKEMLRSEYLEQTGKLVSSCTMGTVVLAILAAVLFAVYFKGKKNLEK